MVVTAVFQSRDHLVILHLEYTQWSCVLSSHKGFHSLITHTCFTTVVIVFHVGAEIESFRRLCRASGTKNRKFSHFISCSSTNWCIAFSLPVLTPHLTGTSALLLTLMGVNLSKWEAAYFHLRKRLFWDSQNTHFLLCESDNDISLHSNLRNGHLPKKWHVNF